MSIFQKGKTISEMAKDAKGHHQHYRKTIGADLTQAPIGEAYETDHQIVICGIPPDDDSHSCDQMGCGQSHVLYRFKKTTETNHEQ